MHLNPHFTNIGLTGKHHHLATQQTLFALCDFLLKKGLNLSVDETLSGDFQSKNKKINLQSLEEIGANCDLVIVVGGDGYMLNAARILSKYEVAVIGVNRGNLGFLTDLSPENFEAPLGEVLKGNYQIEHRFLLKAEILRAGQAAASSTAVNEVVLHPKKIAKMIEFEVYVNDDFMLHQRADGLIISTPTGSTAYSLSGGGPILTPDINAISLLHMFPHTLNSRPIVVNAESCITLKMAENNRSSMQIVCDGHESLSVLPGDQIIIKKSPNLLKLVHPKDYNYFHVLQNKLGWGNKLY